MKLPKEETKRRGNLLKQLREGKKLTQADVAQRFSPEDPVSFARRYQRWESGGSWDAPMEIGFAYVFGVEEDHFRKGFARSSGSAKQGKPRYVPMRRAMYTGGGGYLC